MDMVLTLLKMDCNITNQNEHEWTFINDRQKGLLLAINEEVPRAEHRHCAKHLLSNFQKRFKGVSLEDYAKTSHVPMFEDAMEKMKAENQEAYNWLAKEPPRYWSRSHFKDIVKCDMVCNNLCEAFNKSILEAREKPIIEMLEWIGCYFSRRMSIRREWIRKFTNELLPNCYTKLKENLQWSATCQSCWFGDLGSKYGVGKGSNIKLTLAKGLALVGNGT